MSIFSLNSFSSRGHGNARLFPCALGLTLEGAPLVLSDDIHSEQDGSGLL